MSTKIADSASNVNRNKQHTSKFSPAAPIITYLFYNYNSVVNIEKISDKSGKFLLFVGGGGGGGGGVRPKGEKKIEGKKILTLGNLEKVLRVRKIFTLP